MYRGSGANPNIMILKDSCIFTPSVGNKDGLELGQRLLLLGEMLKARAAIFPFKFTSSSPQTSASNLPRDIVSLVLSPNAVWIETVTNSPYGFSSPPSVYLFSFILLCLSFSRFKLCNCCHGY